MVAIDKQALKDRIDLRDIAEKAFGKYVNRSTNYLMYKCPFHGEHKGASLAVYPDHAICYGKCGKSWDVFAFYQEIYNVPFKQAIEELSGAGAAASAPRRPAPERAEALPPNDEWQHYANQVVTRAQEILWSDEGKPAMDYLRTQRGLGPMIIEEAHLGYIPGSHREWYVWNNYWFQDNGEQVGIPAGITIPHFADGNLWAVKVRRAAGNIKYQAISGGVKCLYWSDGIEPGMPLFVTEGEFDCLVIDQCAGDLVAPISICSAANARHIDSRWLMKFVCAPEVFARMDDDEAGHKAADALGKFTQSLRLVQVPVGKDVTDFYLSAGGVGFSTVRKWVNEVTQAEERIQYQIECMREAGLA